MEARVAKREQRILRAHEAVERKNALLDEEMAGLEGMTEEEAADYVIAERLRKAPERLPTQCMFSGEQLGSLEEAVIHMAKYYGFFIPDLKCVGVAAFLCAQRCAAIEVHFQPAAPDRCCAWQVDRRSRRIRGVLSPEALRGLHLLQL
eukprot:SAG31_NODE_3745_length_3929_cov_2.044125_2_plen_148_part_00